VSAAARIARRIALAGTAIVAVLAGWAAWYAYAPLGLAPLPVEFSVAQGESLRTVSRNLARAGVLPDAWRFELLGRATGAAGALKAGNFQFDADLSAHELLEALTGSAYRLESVVLVEGWTFRQIRAALDAHGALRHDTRSRTDAELLAAAGATEPHPEGLFFPDRYHFARGASDVSVLRRAYLRMQTMLEAQWARRSPDLPLANRYEALVLASIVEKETGRDADRPLVAGVLVNRLRKGMKLQVDPSVIYVLGSEFDGNLRRRDLERDGPYNTYLREGLPPTPIAMPGLASISAALNPAATPALYFVARGDGSSHFSATLVEHNRAVTKYQRSPVGKP